MSGDEPEALNPYQSPLSANASAESVQQFRDPVAASRKRLTLFAMLVPAAIIGVSNGLMFASVIDQLISVFGQIVIYVLAAMWCHYDSIERRLPRWRYFGALMVVCPGPLVMIPVYLLTTRGVSGLVALFGAVAYAAFLTGVMAAFSFGSAFLLYGN